jgi:hypothetical protein
MHDVTGDLRVTHTDLEWWLDLAPRVEWTWARTYADSAPHSYVVLGRTAGLLGRDDEVTYVDTSRHAPGADRG